MGNRDGIVSGFFTALMHAVLALVVLFSARNGAGPYVDVLVFGSVISLVCCVGLVARSHFSSVVLLLLDVLLLGLAIAWCVTAIVAFQTPPPLDGDAFGITPYLEQISESVTLALAVAAVLLSAWLTLRVFRLEKRLRQSHRPTLPRESP